MFEFSLFYDGLCWSILSGSEGCNKIARMLLRLGLSFIVTFAVAHVSVIFLAVSSFPPTFEIEFTINMIHALKFQLYVKYLYSVVRLNQFHVVSSFISICVTLTLSLFPFIRHNCSKVFGSINIDSVCV